VSRRHGCAWTTDAVTVGVLVASGQIILQTAGRLFPSAVRYPGPWVPTATEDTGVYLAAAAELPNLQPHHWTKFLYLLFIRIDSSLGLDGWGLLVFQVLLLAGAGITVLRYVAVRWGRRAGLIGAAALVVNPNVAQWTKTIFTEAVFMPLVVLIVIAAAASLESSRLRPLVLVLAGLSVAVRPNGFGVALGTIAVLSFSLTRRRALSLAVGLALLALVAVFSPAFQTPGGDENTLAARTYEGLVIWVSPDFVRTAMPVPIDESDLSNSAVVRYALQHPIAVLRLGALRVFWEFVQVRSHYPTSINILVALQMIGFFALAGTGLMSAKSHPLTRSILAVSIGMLLVIAGTWAIAEGRFGWAVFAAWSPWVGIGGVALLRRREGVLPQAPSPG
jgi:hypothetical protein